MRKQLPTTHPSLTDATWTKVNTLVGKKNGQQVRAAIHLRNEDTANIIRFELTDTAPTLATEGRELRPGDFFFEDGFASTVDDVYAYQASGGDLTTLAVSEYRTAE